MKLLLALNEGVRSLGSRFDSYQLQVDKKFEKVTAELTLLKNRVDMMEQHNRRMALLDETTGGSAVNRPTQNQYTTHLP